MTCDAREFFKLYFQELERRNIPSAILHSYQELPGKISAPIDYAVPAADLPKLRGIQIELARKHDWALIQTLQSGVFEFHAVLVSLNDPGEYLRLNVCSSSAQGRVVPSLMPREKPRRLWSIFRPAGICLTVMGSDGAGKSTLLENLRKLLEPCFPAQLIFHFRPAVFEKKKTGVVTDPHGQKPRNIFSSWLKVFYYFADYWIGWLLLVLPARARGNLIIFDRGFDDLLVDPKRYRLSETSPLAGVIRRLLPKSDRIFILSALAEVLHRRKPELSLKELGRQQTILQKLAQKDQHYILVSAAEPPDQVARAVWRDVILWLAAREERRS